MTSKQLAFMAYFEAIPQRPTFTQESKYGVPLDHLALGLPFQRLPVNGARGQGQGHRAWPFAGGTESPPAGQERALCHAPRSPKAAATGDSLLLPQTSGFLFSCPSYFSLETRPSGEHQAQLKASV